jgi:hypothetical protein
VSNLMAQLGLGCGRLRGGREESNSRRVLDAALECGIRYFDTAPSYGSEAVLGRGLRGMGREVQVCSKVGLPPGAADSGRTIRAAALAALRRVLPDAALDALKKLPGASPRTVTKARGYGSFEAASIRSSVQQSLERLQRDRLECLLLHEPRMTDPAPEAALILERLVGEGMAVRLGVGTGYQLDELPPFGDVAQFAMGPALFGAADSRTLICHGLLRGLDRGAFERCVAASGIYAKRPALAGLARGSLGISAILLNAVLVGTNVGQVLVSTSSATRLRGFLASARGIFEEVRSGNVDEVRRAFCSALLDYYAVRHVARGAA